NREFDGALRIQLQQIGIGTDVAADEHIAGQLVEGIAFQGLDVVHGDVEIVSNLTDAQTQRFTLAAQQFTRTDVLRLVGWQFFYDVGVVSCHAAVSGTHGIPVNRWDGSGWPREIACSNSVLLRAPRSQT